MNHLEIKIQKQIEATSLLCKTDKILVGLSGGADSVALLRILLNVGFDCHAVHCNFQLRGEESMRDEEFVTQLCNQLNVTLHTTHFDTKQYAKQHGISIEMAARDLRYDYFNQLCKEKGYTKIAIAHHLNDNIETMLLNMMRGTGIKGLTGMSNLRQNIVRPLLQTTKEEIVQYLNEIQQAYITDSSNLEADVQRNKIRLQLLPLMQEIHPAIEQTLNNTQNNLKEWEQFAQYHMQKSILSITTTTSKGRTLIRKDALQEHPFKHLLLLEILQSYGFNNQQTNEVLLALEHTGSIFQSEEYQLLIDRNDLIIRHKPSNSTQKVNLEVPGEAHLDSCTIQASIMPIEQLTSIPKESNKVALSADKLENITLRYVQNGDKFQPFGMKGKKLVSDFLTNLKLNRFDKEEQCVVCSGNDILWVIGQRIDQQYAITPQTKKVLVLELMA